MQTKHLTLDYNPRPWQRECHLGLKRFSVLALHRRAGKTETAVMELIDKALKIQLELGLFVYVAPFLSQARAIAWVRLKHRLKPILEANAATVSESDLSVKFKHNGAIIRLFGGDNPDALRGVRLDGVVVDEVAQIKPEVWDEIIQPALSDRKGWALFIGTPNGVNLFSELFFKATRYDDWYAARYTVHETHSIDMDEVERLRRDMSEGSFAREYLCDFSAAGEDQLISLADIHEAAKRQVLDTEVRFAPKIIGIDPARFGDDRSAVVLRQGLKCWVLLDKPKIDNMDLAAMCAEFIDLHKPASVFCDAGAGSGVIDRLRMLGHKVAEVAFGGKPSNEIYANKRSEIWHELATWIKSGADIPDEMRLKQDLASPTYFYSHTGKLQLESKEQMKKRGLPSPDVADALALCFAAPVSVRAKPVDYPELTPWG
jgi:hypothetical protein